MKLLKKLNNYLFKNYNKDKIATTTLTTTMLKPGVSIICDELDTTITLKPGVRIITETEQTANNTKPKATKKSCKRLRKLAIATAMTFALQFGSAHLINNLDNLMENANKLNSFNLYANKIKQTTTSDTQEPVVLEQIELEKQAERNRAINQSVNEFTQGLQSKVTQYEREVLARMLYGEAGRGADPFEILHTVLNRASSPLFKGSLADIVLQKGQYVGYSEKHPLTKDYLTMVDMAIADWEANGCQKIEGCDHYYFVTGIAGVCNKFEISPANNYGRWIPTKDKKYAKLQNYCPTATEQAERFFTARDGKLNRAITMQK